jgi:hypothetical protein
LYPFSWQHTLIPVLPTSLLDICSSPTPYIVGILRSRDASLVPGPVDEVCFILCPFVDGRFVKASTPLFDLYFCSTLSQE